MREPDGCATDHGVPRWARRRGALVGAMTAWLALLLLEPVAYTVDLHPAWPSWLGLVVVAATFLGCGLVAVGVVTALAALTVARTGGTSDRLTTTVVVTGLAGLGCWSFRQLFMVIAELAATREELARLAVERERERFSRDLHDLLGHTLSLIVVKAQAVRRLAPRDAAAAAQHGADIETIGRRALREVRQAVDGYRGGRLDAELDRAREALAAAGIALVVDESPVAGPLPPDVDALFGWVVREGATNVLRHSGAGRCVIAWSRHSGAALLEITDDGGAAEAEIDGEIDGAPGHGGNGLAGVRERVTAAGGRCVAGRVSSGFRVSVDVPVPPPDSPLAPAPARAAR